MLPNNKYINEYTCEGTNIAVICKTFVTVTYNIIVISIIYRYSFVYTFKHWQHK